MRISELDLFRFLAASAVMFYHLYDFHYGYLGVNFFFMLSGFVILWTAERSDWIEFCISRFSRLYPTFWVCMSITVFYVWFTSAEIPSLYEFMANATMAAGYLGADYIDGVYWTLQVELKFYLLIFTLLVARQIPRIELWLWVWLAAGTLGEFFRPVASLTLHPYHSYFIGGCALFLIWSRGLDAKRLALLLLCGAASAYHARFQVAQFVTGVDQSWIPPVVVLLLFALLFTLAMKWIRFAHPYWVTLGAASYPLYLLHNSIGQSTVVAVVLLTVLVTLYVDRPLHRHIRSFLTVQYRRVTDET
ncbi:acyltransferase family protein [Gilvimarinus sp. F26214L]|uniref:acyltransferase family protein n=1 Tax=Gilvimarinus sp. DZF01 TaxID=3461371 RepID=UPI0040463DBE